MHIGITHHSWLFFHLRIRRRMSPSLCCMGFSFLSRNIAAVSSPCRSTSRWIHSDSRELWWRGFLALTSCPSCAACRSSCLTISVLDPWASCSLSERSFSGSLSGFSRCFLMTRMMLPVSGSRSTSTSPRPSFFDDDCALPLMCSESSGGTSIPPSLFGRFSAPPAGAFRRCARPRRR